MGQLTNYVIDVLDGKDRTSIPRAVWMSGAGHGEFYTAEKSRFAEVLRKLTDGDKSRPIVTMCINSMCWLSYNAALYAVEAGYTNVYWYRGGSDAWTGAGYDRKRISATSW